MRGGATPPALLFAALGLGLAFTPRDAWAPSLLAVLVTLVALLFVPIPRAWLEGVFLGCWISVIVTAASVHLARRLSGRAALLLSINAGIWATAVTGLSGSPLDLVKALPCALILWPAAWVMSRYGSIPLKVTSSWLIAIAALAAALQLLPVTPGYMPDHLE
jgi:hypothetical protein